MKVNLLFRLRIGLAIAIVAENYVIVYLIGNIEDGNEKNIAERVLRTNNLCLL